MIELSEEQTARYSRHLMLSEVGEKGQKKLLSAKVLVIGLGGLGSPVSYYLAAAGVGCLGLLDSDVVDISNLQRQILHSTPTIGMPKVISAKRTINALNPDVNVRIHHERLTEENAQKIIREYDIVVDASDNLPTRYVMNDACMSLNKPLVHGSIFQFEGRATVFVPWQGPCYRCLFPEMPPQEMLPGPNDIGLLGVLPGVIGTIEATETIKLILGIGNPLIERLIVYDALNMNFMEIRTSRSKACKLHG